MAAFNLKIEQPRRSIRVLTPTTCPVPLCPTRTHPRARNFPTINVRGIVQREFLTPRIMEFPVARNCFRLCHRFLTAFQFFKFFKWKSKTTPKTQKYRGRFRNFICRRIKKGASRISEWCIRAEELKVQFNFRYVYQIGVENDFPS